jgi:shikimate kinase
VSRWPRNIILIGFMGSGKSSIGRLVARKLRFRFVDTDRIIVQRAGMEISRIFAGRGEESFRGLETEALSSLSDQKQCVIATGGGVVTQPRNLPLLNELGAVVWLTAAEEVIFDRVSRNRKRPLLHTENPRDTIHALLEERRPLYAAAAQVTIDSTGLTHAQAANAVLDAVRLQEP